MIKRMFGRAGVFVAASVLTHATAKHATTRQASSNNRTQGVDRSMKRQVAGKQVDQQRPNGQSQVSLTVSAQRCAQPGSPTWLPNLAPQPGSLGWFIESPAWP